MDLRKMATLTAIADLGSFSRAALAVNLTQSAVSQQMQELEAGLGVTLFDRESRPPKLTVDGRAYVELARSVLSEHRSFVAARSHNQLTGTLTVGAVRSALNLTLPKAIRSLEKDYPHLHLRLINSGRLSADLTDLVRSQQIDVALIVGPPVDDREVVWRPYATERFFVVAPLEKRGATAEALLMAGPYLRFVPNLPIEHRIEKELERRNLNLECHMELDTFESVLLMASEGLGVGIVPERYVGGADRQKVQFAPFGSSSFFRELGIVYHCQCEKTSLIDVLFSELVDSEHVETE